MSSCERRIALRQRLAGVGLDEAAQRGRDLRCQKRTIGRAEALQIMRDRIQVFLGQGCPTHGVGAQSCGLQPFNIRIQPDLEFIAHGFERLVGARDRICVEDGFSQLERAQTLLARINDFRFRSRAAGSAWCTQRRHWIQASRGSRMSHVAHR
jgi:hypothetical protein